jgi:pimeloyl-ACP methyl ester carboxylesterase
VSAYEDGRFAQSTRYVRSYPGQLAVLRDLLPAVRVPVHVFAAGGDPMVPVSSGRYLAERIPGRELTILAAGHFAWEEVPASLPRSWRTGLAVPRQGPHSYVAASALLASAADGVPAAITAWRASR